MTPEGSPGRRRSRWGGDERECKSSSTDKTKNMVQCHGASWKRTSDIKKIDSSLDSQNVDHILGIYTLGINNLGPPIFDLERQTHWDRSLDSGNLQSRGTDFGSGHAHSLNWEFTLWKSTSSGHRFWIWKCTLIGLGWPGWESTSWESTVSGHRFLDLDLHLYC